MNLPSIGSSSQSFDEDDEFVPAHLPEPGGHLADHDVLTDEDHVRIHALARDLFEERGVYDVTTGYNLAKLSLDRRHPDAGFRYAESATETDVLIAAFTPTTAFCPGATTLATGSFRAWNGLADRHEYDLVRVRVANRHQESGAINAALRAIERRFEQTGELVTPADEGNADGDD